MNLIGRKTPWSVIGDPRVIDNALAYWFVAIAELQSEATLLEITLEHPP